MIDWIMDTPKCAVYAGMGLGKTCATLTAIDRLHLCSMETKPVLVVAPLRVARDVWSDEAANWEHLQHLKVVPIVGTVTQRHDALRYAHGIQADVYTVNLENIEWLVAQCQPWPFGMIVLDESTRVKSLRASIRTNPDGKSWIQGVGGTRAKALLKVIFANKTSRIVELTGTPTPLGLSDLWGPLFLLDYGKRLGRTFDSFKNRWFRVGFNGWGMDPLPTAQAEIETAIRDLCLSVRSEDHFPVEKPIVRTILVHLPPDAKRQYREMEKSLFTEIAAHPVEAFNAGAKTMKLLQMASGAAYLGHADDPGERAWVEVHTAKLDALESIVEEASGAPLLVAYHFKSDLARILARFPKARHLDQKPQTIRDWNTGKIPILCAHPGSAGHGLSLQMGGHHLVYFTSDWNGEARAQILERIGPVRQKQSGLIRNVFVYELIVAGTIDEEVRESHLSKCSVQESLLTAMKRRP